jgi:hypothetical protein
MNFWLNVTNAKRQNFKQETKTKNELIKLPQRYELNQRIHMDLFGPLKTSESGKNS